MNYILYIILSSFAVNHASFLDDTAKSLLPESLDNLVTGIDSFSAYGFSTSNTDIYHLKDIYITKEKLSSQYLVSAVFKTEVTDKIWCLFSIKKNNENIIQLCFYPIGANSSRISLETRDGTFPFLYGSDFKNKWTNVTFDVTDNAANVRVNCIYAESVTNVKPASEIYLTEDMELTLAVGKDAFQVTIQEIKIYPRANKDTIKNVCNDGRSIFDITDDMYDYEDYNDLGGDESGSFSSDELKLGKDDKCKCTNETLISFIKSSPELRGPPGEKGSPGKDGEHGRSGLTGNIGPQGERGPQGYVGEKGEKGVIGKTGQKGIEGPKGEPGKDGLPGYPGPEGQRGLTGPPGPIYVESDEERNARIIKIPGIRGDTGPTGPPGTPGERGPPGERGEKGDEGIQGPEGKQGKDGEKGSRGEKGDRGEAGINGLPGDPGMNGKDGEKGDKGEVGNPGAPGEPASITSILYEDIAPETTKNILEKFRGFKGDKGSKGFKGSQGDLGPQGLQGTPGTDGKDGETGDVGRQGQKGEPGSPGADGLKGERGEPGPPCPDYIPTTSMPVLKNTELITGPRGPKGEKGDTGKIGPIGRIGQKGAMGNVGPMGPKGSRGEKGAGGEKGEKGDSSTVINLKEHKGERGDRGLDGRPGIQGPRGPTGPEGPPGSVGPPGHDGQPGPKGETGPPGLSIVGQKGEKGDSYFRDFETISVAVNEEDAFYPVNTFVYATIKGLMKASYSMPIGTMVYIIQERILLIKPSANEWNRVMMEPLKDGRQDTSTITKHIPPKSSPSKMGNKRQHIRLIALDDPHTGSIYGTTEGADNKCHEESMHLYHRGFFKAFRAKKIEYLKYLVQSQYWQLPVVNIYGTKLFDTWESMFNGSGAKIDLRRRPAHGYNSIYSFKYKDVFIDDNWPDKKIWHGARSNGDYSENYNCRDWSSNSRHEYGSGSSLKKLKLLDEELFSCDMKLIVLCVEVIEKNVRHRSVLFNRHRRRTRHNHNQSLIYYQH